MIDRVVLGFLGRTGASCCATAVAISSGTIASLQQGLGAEACLVWSVPYEDYVVGGSCNVVTMTGSPMPLFEFLKSFGGAFVSVTASRGYYVIPKRP